MPNGVGQSNAVHVPNKATSSHMRKVLPGLWISKSLISHLH